MRRKYYLSLTEFKQARYSGKTGYLRAYETQILFESYRIQKSVTEFKKVLQNSKSSTPNKVFKGLDFKKLQIIRGN